MYVELIIKKKKETKTYLYWYAFGDVIKLHGAAPHIRARILQTVSGWSAGRSREEQENSWKSRETEIHGGLVFFSFFCGWFVSAVRPFLWVMGDVNPASF